MEENYLSEENLEYRQESVAIEENNVEISDAEKLAVDLDILPGWYGRDSDLNHTLPSHYST